MTKEQAAEKYAKEINVSDRNVYRKAEKDFTAGWEAHEAQSPTDAVALANKIASVLENTYKKYNPGPHFDYSGFALEVIINLKPLFNPLGEAPKAPVSKKNYPEPDRYVRGYRDAIERLSSDQPPAGPVWVGLNWVKVEDKFPPFIRGHYTSRESATVLVSQGEMMDWAKYIALDSGGQGWVGCHWTPTHWAYVYPPNETAPTQQLFTREQVEAAHSAGVIAGNKQAAGEEFQTQEEYMNTNYPKKP